MPSKKRTTRPGIGGQRSLESQALSQAIRKLLQDHGITAQRCAKDIGIAHSQLYGLTSGAASRNMTAVLALKLGRYFGRNPEDLMQLQVRKELAAALQEYGDEIQSIVPLVELATRTTTTPEF